MECKWNNKKKTLAVDVSTETIRKKIWAVVKIYVFCLIVQEMRVYITNLNKILFFPINNNPKKIF